MRPTRETQRDEGHSFAAQRLAWCVGPRARGADCHWTLRSVSLRTSFPRSSSIVCVDADHMNAWSVVATVLGERGLMRAWPCCPTNSPIGMALSTLNVPPVGL